MTQRQLAERLQVDQGTVSRWERGTDTPRPAREAMLRDLLLKGEEKTALAQTLAIVRHDFLSRPTSFLDTKLRVAEMSRTGKAFLRRRGYDPQNLIGQDVDSWSERFDLPDFPELLRSSGLLNGNALLMRFVRNDRGHGHVTVYEPVFAEGDLIGILNYVTLEFEFLENNESTLELIQVVPAANPGQIETLFKGARSDAAIAALSDVSTYRTDRRA